MASGSREAQTVRGPTSIQGIDAELSFLRIIDNRKTTSPISWTASSDQAMPTGGRTIRPGGTDRRAYENVRSHAASSSLYPPQAWGGLNTIPDRASGLNPPYQTAAAPHFPQQPTPSGQLQYIYGISIPTYQQNSTYDEAWSASGTAALSMPPSHAPLETYLSSHSGYLAPDNTQTQLYLRPNLNTPGPAGNGSEFRYRPHVDGGVVALSPM